MVTTNSQPHYRPAKSPLYVYGDSSIHNSMSYLTNNLCQSLWNFGIDIRSTPRPAAYGTPECIEDFLPFRRFQFKPPSKPHSALYLIPHDTFVYNRNTEKVFTWSGMDDLAIFNPSLRRLFSIADQNFVYSQAAKEIYHKLKIKSTVLHPGVVSLQGKRLTHTVGQLLSGNQDFSYYLPPFLKVYTFLGMPQQRKALGQTIEAFYAAFQGNYEVLLWIHGRPEHWGNTNDLGTFYNYKSLCDAPPMIWTTGVLSNEDIGNFFHTSYCHLMPSYLEGFGLTALQAASVGVPTILVPQVGPAEWSTASNSYQLPFTNIECPYPELPKDLPWAAWKTEDMVELLRKSFWVPDKHKAKGLSARVISKRFNWQDTAHQLLPYLDNSLRDTSFIRSITDILIPVSKSYGRVGLLLDELLAIRDFIRVYTLVTDPREHYYNNVNAVKDLLDHKMQPAVLFQENYGPYIGLGQARNILMAESSGGYVCFMDCDVLPTTVNWLTRFKKVCANKHVVAPTLLFNDSELIQSSGGSLNHLHRLYKQSRSNCKTNIQVKLPYAPGACLFTTRHIATQVGWCEDYPHYNEDVHFCYEARRLGYDTLLAADVIFRHEECSTVKDGVQTSERNKQLAEESSKIWEQYKLGYKH